jgi:flagellar motor switch protein FliN
MSLAEQIAHVADVPLALDLELDRKFITVRDILKWDLGSVIWMTRSAGENIDVYAGGVLFGFGEIVVIENQFGVRITGFNLES